MEKNFELKIGDSLFHISIGKVAEQASGACIVRHGDTMVLVTATASNQPREGIDFFPLTVDFEEKLYAVGKIPGGFIKREGRPSEKAVLTSRLMDRPLRPLFPDGYRNDVQIIASVLSVDQDHIPDIAAMIGSSIALSISHIPFDGPTAAVLVCRKDGQFVLNPKEDVRNESDIYLVVAGTEDAIMMVEAGADEVPEEDFLDAILFAHEAIKDICKSIKAIAEEVGVAKAEFTPNLPDAELVATISEFAMPLISESMFEADKMLREEKIQTARQNVVEHFINEFEDETLGKTIGNIFDDLEKQEVRRQIIEMGKRPDNRTLTEIRPITCEVGLLPRTHGSGLFTRGQTQALSIATLAPLSEVQIIDGIGDDESKKYIHHYNFPPFCVGDTRPMRSPGRREIGHGALAEKALRPMIPSEDEFPYTIRVVSEILSSNGSSSQASVCGSTLALMDAGVPIKAPVAGIAMGLIKEGDNIAILSDIQGLEDHLGDMDFKVAGTSNGVTAIQMDIKIDGINRDVLEKALKQAKEGRLHILGKMAEAINKPSEELSPFAPRIIRMQIDPDKIREVIGSGGKVINKIIEDTGVKIDIEDDGRIYIAAVEPGSGEAAMKIIEAIVKEVEVGEVYEGKVTRILKFGAFVELLKGKEGLVHISQLAHKRVEKVEDILKVGDTVKVKVTEIDDQGRINVSRKALLPKED
ncbi:MAG: polyribonucleotide nucleotidyltransferase [Tissierellia bacterium]|nr:polyribonucleotide nucleotidyltransferase [Tissierellia bacterium]